MTTSISNHDDIIDSRDVIARLLELEDERGDLEAAVAAAMEADAETTEEAEAAHDAALQMARDELTAWDDDNGDELEALQNLAEQAEGYSDWKHGAILVRDSYFQTYAQELADDLGLIDNTAKWPATCIDWEQAADELQQQDYTSVEFDGVTYWVC